MVNRVMEWLDEEAQGILTVLGYALLAGLVSLSLSQIVRAALMNYGFLPMPKLGEVDPLIKYMNGYILAEMLVIWPIMEEIMFRFLPLAVVIAFVSAVPRFIFGANLLFATLFGAMHPYALYGRIDVAISGFMFGIVFLKCGGIKKRFFKASVAAIASHIASNVFILLYSWWEYLEYAK